MAKKSKQLELQLKVIQLKEEKMPMPKVSILTNSVHYSLFRVFIFEDKGQFRLIVFNQGKLLTDAIYKTARGARIAFLKLWGFQREADNVTAKWSHFYTPEKYWLETWYHFVIERKFISLLINAVCYFLETVLIMFNKDRYQLIVIHRGKVWTDEIYKTFEEAKSAFLNRYKDKAWKEGVKANWSHFYPPDAKWLKKKLEPMANTQ
jgi:hypothetical protein